MHLVCDAANLIKGRKYYIFISPKHFRQMGAISKLSSVLGLISGYNVCILSMRHISHYISQV